jgi:hypothetical protein
MELDRELNPNKKKYKKTSNEPLEEIIPSQKIQTSKNTQATQAMMSQAIGGKKVKKSNTKDDLPTNSQFMKIDNFFKKK